MARWTWWRSLPVLAAALSTGALAEDDEVLRTVGFTDCGGDTTVKINNLDISYDNSNKFVNFDIVGVSTKTQNVTASLSVKAYGNDIYSQSFNPCEEATYVDKLCPVPAGSFQAQGSQNIPAQFASMVPEIAFKIPDIEAFATLELHSLDGSSVVTCIQSEVTNGKSVNQPAVSYAAAAIAGAALIMSGVSAVSAATSGGVASGAGSSGPGFTEVTGWFQGMAINGMLSVNYPPIYRKFTKNFAFSTGIIPWDGLLQSIDDFRAKTGGNLTEDSVEYLRNATLIFPDGSISTPDSHRIKAKRLWDAVTPLITRRDIDASVNDTIAESEQSIQKAVSGIQAFAAELAVPKSDIFMTALLIVAIVIAIIVFGVLLIKAILETWALFGSFPQSLAGFRKHYWNSISRSITSLILLLYGVWVLYCVFQFTLGDSWAAKILAAVSLGIFTSVLVVFSYLIWSTAERLKTQDGDVSRLFEEKSIWVKYSMFYDSYRKSCWWIFMPTIVYLLVKGCVLAAADGHGMVQSVSVTIIEALMLSLLIWSRPYESHSKNILCISIQAVRLLSIACIFVFVEEFGIAKTTQTVMGLVLIAIQSGLTVTLSILIVWNVINSTIKMNPHRKRRKQMEKIHDMDDLTPLDARNSLLIGSSYSKNDVEKSMYPISLSSSLDKRPSLSSSSRYYPMPEDNNNNNNNNNSKNSSSSSSSSNINYLPPYNQQNDHGFFSQELSGGPMFRSLTPGFCPSGPPSPDIHTDAGEHDFGRAHHAQAPSYEFHNGAFRGF